MYEIRQGVGAVVAADTRSTVTALDTAVVMQSRMCASVLEAAADSNLPIGATQAVLDSLTSGMRGLIASRADLVDAVREITQIQRRSTLKVTSFGCPGGQEGPNGHHAAPQPQADRIETTA